MAALAAAMMVVTVLVVMTMMARELKAAALLPSNGICVLLGCSLQACGTHVVGFRFRFNLLFCDFPMSRPLKHEHVSGRENFEQHNTN